MAISSAVCGSFTYLFIKNISPSKYSRIIPSNASSSPFKNSRYLSSPLTKPPPHFLYNRKCIFPYNIIFSEKLK